MWNSSKVLLLYFVRKYVFKCIGKPAIKPFFCLCVALNDVGVHCYEDSVHAVRTVVLTLVKLADIV